MKKVAGSRRRRRPASLMTAALASAAFVLAVAAGVSAEHQVGAVWFCHTISFCSSTSSPQIFSANSTVYIREDGGLADTEYYIRYILGTDLMSDCNTSSSKLYNYTNNTDNFRTSASGTFNKQTRMISTPGLYSVCGTPLTGVSPTFSSGVTVLP